MRNPLLIKAGKDILKFLLSQCEESQVVNFIRMYGKDETELEKVIDGIDPDKIDWAITQVQNTLIKNGHQWIKIES